MVTSEYDLGEVDRVDPILGGFENLSFGVRTRGDDGEHRYFVRKYKHGTVEREIRYEHALVRHIRSKGFDLAAEVFETRHGDTARDPRGAARRRAGHAALRRVRDAQRRGHLQLGREPLQ